MLWQCKSSASASYVDMPEPSSYEIDGEDVDTDTYRSVVNHNIVRTNISYKWQKMQMMFRFKTEAEANALITAINHYPLYCRFRTPIMTTADNSGNYWKELEGYISKVSLKMHDIELGYEVSFNFVEGIR